MLSNTDLKIFFKNLKDQPLEPDNPFYVNYLEENPNAPDPIKELQNNIILNDDTNYSVGLISGQRGNGKSTELYRLQNLLEQDDYVVLFCDMQNYMNLHFPVEITDFLISIMLALTEAVKSKYGKDFKYRSYTERLKDIFTRTQIQLGDIDFTGDGDTPFKLALRQDPTIKKRLQTNLRGHVTYVVQQAHEFSQDIVKFIRQYDDKEIVLLVDSVEQIRGVGGNAKEVHESIRDLFSNHSDKLCLQNFHIIYTVPPYLPALSSVRSLDATIMRSIDNIHVFQRDNTIDPKGVAIMRDIIQRRFPNWQQIFSEEQLRDMILATGGDLRDFFRLIRAVLVKIDINLLPVKDNIIISAKNDLRRSMLPIPKDDMEWLRRISESKQSELQTIDDLPRLARFFDNNLVQNYRNGDDWYDIHPLLKDVINN
ncbi:MAG: hypothetical protein KAG43_10345 [Candidatus Marithrix sp.]|nr:hypothetical protein [Candidatus Marithrix sp.]